MGPWLGAILVIRLAGIQNPMSWGGSRPVFSLLMGLCFVLAFTSMGYPNQENVNPNYYGFWLALMLLAYAYGEEYGWRGYLEYELDFMPPLMRYLLIGSIWYLWHLHFLSDPSLLANLKFWGICVLASWGIAQIARTTFSVMACACFHLIGNLLGTSKTLSQSMSPEKRFGIIGLCIAFWVILVVKWRAKKEINT